MSRNLSRRRFLSVGAGALGAAAVGSLLPPSLQSALAAPVGPGSLDSIEHVVLLMQENRSFDHYFGALRGVRGFGDPNALTLRNGHSVFEQPGPGGPVLPFPIRASAQAQRMDTQNVTGLDHSWEGGHQALAGGWHDGWIAAKTPTTMAYYGREDIPFHYELADAFTICDAYHCSVPTSTSPNRNYWVSGYTGFEPDGSRAVTNAAYDPWHAGYPWSTVPERLQAAGVTWKTYQEWDTFSDNNLEYFTVFKKVAAHLLGNPGLVPYELQTLSGFYLALPKMPPEVQDVALRALEGAVNGLSPADRVLYDRALRRSRPGTLAAEFRRDVESGSLPQVSYLVPSEVDSEHPSGSSPAASATLVYQVLDAIAADPDLWAKTVVIINFDENDGYFDHVPPPRPPRDAADEWVGTEPLGLGPRVPMTIVSPWTVGGFVCSEVFDHTSTTRFLEKRFGFTQPEISRWRRTVSGDLTSAFDFAVPRSRPSLARPAATPPLDPRWTPTPPANQQMPVQERGTRPARPLPYQPDGHAVMDPKSRTLALDLTNSGKASAHFSLYPYAGEFTEPRHYDVLGTVTDTVSVTGERYALTLLGPNGFRREIQGSVAGAAGALTVRTTVDQGARALRLTVHNPGAEALTVRLDGAERGVEPGAESSWTVRSTDGWYDATLTVSEDRTFRRRLTGHIENGRVSVSAGAVSVTDGED
ncbi:phosphocholine-specific phospholipase C [Rhodococcus sp. NPDC059234]|uniref:phosphocholine-specific phospholipase C n=1 Tax=Rhodococcus sp. NPDC059234 TaxID=3346781 RepID=UPI00366B6A55